MSKDTSIKVDGSRDEFERCMSAIYLELPKSVADDVNKIVRTHIKEHYTPNEVVDKRIVEARLDELDKFKTWYYFDRLQEGGNPIENYYDDRIKGLGK